MLAALDAYLSSRSYFVGYALSAADVAVWGALVGARQWEALAKGAAGKTPHLLRWFNHVGAAAPALPAALAKYAPKKVAAKAAKKESAAAAADEARGAPESDGPPSPAQQIVLLP